MSTFSRNITFSIFLLYSLTTSGQNARNIDSLKRALTEQKNDSNKVKLLNTLSFAYAAGSYADTALVYSQQALKLSEELNYQTGIFWSEITLCESLAILGNHQLALEHSFKALALAKRLNDTLILCYGNGNLASCYFHMGEYNASIHYAAEVLKIMDSDDNYWMWIQMSKAFYALGQADSALFYARKAYAMIKGTDLLLAKSAISSVLGNAYAGKASYDSALLFYRMGITLSIKGHAQTHLVDNYNGIAAVYNLKGNLDSALWYCKEIIAEKVINAYPAGLLKATSLLTKIYEAKHNPDSSLKYLKSTIAIKDSLSNRQKTIAIQNLIYKEQEKQNEIQAVKRQLRSELRMYGLIGGLLILMIIAGILFRNHRRKQFQRIRNSIADDLHDDIGSTLSSISIMSELAKVKSPQASTLLNSIGESTMSIQENMSDIVWAIKAENDSFENILLRMKQFASEIFNAKNIALDFESDPLLYSSKLSMKQRKNFYLFFKEVANNAAKHSGAKNISIRIAKNEHLVELIISDDGKGFETKQAFDGNGMSSLKKRAEELNGHYRIQSNPKEGTVVELKFKI